MVYHFHYNAIENGILHFRAVAMGFTSDIEDPTLTYDGTKCAENSVRFINRSLSEISLAFFLIHAIQIISALKDSQVSVS